MIKKLISHSALYGLAPQIPRIAGFFVLPIITKDLTQLDYGISGLITAYVAGFSAFQGLGLNVVIGNAFYKYSGHYKWLWRQLLGFLTIYSIFFGLFMSGILYFVIPKEASNNLGIIIFLNVLPIILFGPSQQFIFRFYQKNEKPMPLAIRTVIIGFITVFLNLYFISYLKMGYMGWFWSSFIGSSISFFIFFYPFYFKYKFTPIFNFKWRTIRHALKVGLPTIPHYYSSYLLNSSDRVVMDLFRFDIEKIGLYNFASNFGNYFSAAGDALGLAVSPIYLKIFKENGLNSGFKIRNITWIMQTAFLAVTFLICLWLKEIFGFLVNNEMLRKTYPIAIIIIMGYNYRPMYLGSIHRIFYQERTRILWKVSFVAGASNVILNVILLPIFGVTAAAVITFLTLLYMGYSGYYLKLGEKNTVSFYPEVWCVITILLSCLAYFAADSNIFLKIGVSFSVLIISIIALKKFNNIFEE